MISVRERINMYGAIIGDIAGSRFEFNNHRSKEFKLFTQWDFFTDDTVMTIAVAKALHESKKNDYTDLEEKLIYWMKEIGRRYPDCGYGGNFAHWIMSDDSRPYNSFGNGSGMRTSECAWIANSLSDSLKLAERCAAVTHNHPEGIKGAQAVTACIYLARKGKTKEEIREYTESRYYRLDFTLDQIRPVYRFNETCQDSVPQAIEAFLESDSFEDAIRNAISIGGDSDTIAAMTGSIAEAYYGIEEDMVNQARSYLDSYLLDCIESMKETSPAVGL
jgi:type I restriction enzyme M protein